ncbi:uncharacterized protein FOBCDRAFT_282812 [Fusarium oxysporum Fo47]|uniref:Uncharacterized protein n=1 Tax=Fusarium oxysporum Fo47 TaxID=660027 RepID=W9JWJ4_FUSOX|nr:uncharacterized protein FOBCDRAFT_282812 [Fusarium oxysporum Fo47]EWZ34025.1 hypothetical protein FOZG_13707 [Fusarium oxysporum Fo47]WJG37405.1 hypothetical protein FOBCDRAFT_282812 [Fusarium oxysporum Fo47]
MIDPISITIITLACSVAAALKSVYDMICKFFKSISNWRLSRMFKEIGSLMQQYKRDGWLPASQKATLSKLMEQARAADWKGKLRSEGQYKLLKEADGIETDICNATS